MRKLFISLLLTFSVSSLFGIIFKDWIVFILATILQYLFFYFFNSMYENWLKNKIMQNSLELEKVKSKNTVKLNCPTCDNVEEVEMTFNGAVVYKCGKCDAEIKAEPIVKNYLTTNPIYFDK
jgi:ribosomal protein L37AE/L43A